MSRNLKSLFLNLRISLGLRLIVLIIAIFIFFGLIFMAMNILFFWRKSNDDFQNKIAYIADFTANSNSANVWNLDYVNLQKYIESLLIEKNLISVIFETSHTSTIEREQHFYGLVNNSVLDKKGKEISDVAPLESTFSYHLERPIIYQEMPIGKVHLYFSDEFILIQALHQTKLFLINMVAFVLFFSISIYFALKQQLLVPLKKIHHLAMSVSGFTTYLSETVSQEQWRQVQQMLVAEQKNQDRLKQKMGNDELGDFMQAFLLVLNGFELIVSELSQYSEQLQTMNDDLEQRIKNRTIELENSNGKISESLIALQKTQGQLIQQEKLASIGQLAAGVAHEINNPIGYIGSNINRLDEYFIDLKEIISQIDSNIDALPVEANAAVKNEIAIIKKRLDFDFISEDFSAVISDCREGISRVKEIVQSLKDFSHNVDEKEFAEIDINNAINTTLKVVNNEIKYYCDVELDLQLNTKVAANLGQLHQVISNLVVNASQAMREVGKRGLLSIRSFSEGGFAIIEIEDTGGGIPEEIHTKIFDPFFTTKPIGQGTGLGLNISYDIVVNKHKGDLSFISKLGVGTIFKIKLPLEVTRNSIELADF
jgi:two-component system, NtrC family, sensor kinase